MLTAATKFALLLMTLRFVGVDDDVLPWTQVFVVFALVQGLTVFPITAGDAGVSEIAYIGMLTAAAGEEWVNQITAAVLIFRILTWLLLIPVGLGVLGFWRHQLRRNPPALASRSMGRRRPPRADCGSELELHRGPIGNTTRDVVGDESLVLGVVAVHEVVVDRREVGDDRVVEVGRRQPQVASVVVVGDLHDRRRRAHRGRQPVR